MPAPPLQPRVGSVGRRGARAAAPPCAACGRNPLFDGSSGTLAWNRDEDNTRRQCLVTHAYCALCSVCRPGPSGALDVRWLAFERPGVFLV